MCQTQKSQMLKIITYFVNDINVFKVIAKVEVKIIN